MAKIKISLIGLLCVLTLLCAHGQGSVRQRIVDSARSQVGVREATGHNDGAAVEKYLRACHLGKGYAWCAAFLAWDFQVNHVPALTSAWAPDWFPASKTILRPGLMLRLPQPGDVFGLYMNGRIAHVGIVYVWSDKVVTTIEGNTNLAGSREGDGVYVKKRLRRQINCVSSWVH